MATSGKKMTDEPGVWRDLSRSVAKNERGITGLETAIVLIAFVVVASVFAFAVLSTGLLSSEKSKETVLGALAETAATISIRGSVVAQTNAPTTTPVVNYITFQVGNASQSGDAVDLTSDRTIVSYIDSSQSVSDIGNVPTATTTQGWNAVWLSGTGGLLEPGERAEITVGIQSLSTRLGVGTEFTIEVRPSSGAVLIVNRTTPAELTAVVDLR